MATPQKHLKAGRPATLKIGTVRTPNPFLDTKVPLDQIKSGAKYGGVVQIEKGIPFEAEYRRGRKQVSKYPWVEMEIGDSFFVEKKGITSMMRIWGKRTGFKFASRAVEGGRRVWRIE